MVERILRDGRRLERHLDDGIAERSPPAPVDGSGSDVAAASRRELMERCS